LGSSTIWIAFASLSILSRTSIPLEYVALSYFASSPTSISFNIRQVPIIGSPNTTCKRPSFLLFDMQSSLFLAFLAPLLASCDVVPALERHTPETRPQLLGRSPHTSINNLGKRQFCPSSYGFCIANNGDTVCQAFDEVCCQLTTGSDAYTCDALHPYCCGADASTGILLCGSSSSCGSDFANAPNAAKPTEATGEAGPTKTAATAAQNTAGGGDNKKKGSAAALDAKMGGVAMGVVAGVMAAL
jgi:hypothetical protein